MARFDRDGTARITAVFHCKSVSEHNIMECYTAGILQSTRNTARNIFT
jgi:hypothetical protein